MINNVILETERLLIREINEDDTEDIVKWRSNPEVYKFFLNPKKITPNEHLIWYRNSYLNNTDRYDFMAIEKISNQNVGVFGIKKNTDKSTEFEISYIIDALYYGKGYATEAMKCIINYAKDIWNAKTVIAEINKNNYFSIRYIEKNMGFKKYNEKAEFIIYKKDI